MVNVDKTQFKDVTRFEVVDAAGRAYVSWGVRVEVFLQDDNRTLKVFVYNREESNA